jgi:hypothetical protein
MSDEDDPLIYKASFGEFRIDLDAFTTKGLEQWLVNLRKAEFSNRDRLIERIEQELRKRLAEK